MLNYLHQECCKYHICTLYAFFMTSTFFVIPSILFKLLFSMSHVRTVAYWKTWCIHTNMWKIRTACMTAFFNKGHFSIGINKGHVFMDSLFEVMCVKWNCCGTHQLCASLIIYTSLVLNIFPHPLNFCQFYSVCITLSSYCQCLVWTSCKVSNPALIKLCFDKYLYN